MLNNAPVRLISKNQGFNLEVDEKVIRKSISEAERKENLKRLIQRMADSGDPYYNP